MGDVFRKILGCVWYASRRGPGSPPKCETVSRAIHVFLLLATLLCAGCAWFWDEPSAYSPRSRIEARDLQSIVVGSTTKEDMLLRFGEPQERFDAPTVFLYRWVREKGFVFFAVGTTGAGGTSRDQIVEYTLHVLFDERDRVSRYHVSTVVLRQR